MDKKTYQDNYEYNSIYYNINKCNSSANRNEAYGYYRQARNIRTNSQYDEILRLNKILEEHGLNTFVPSMYRVECHNILKSQYSILAKNGIPSTDERNVKCADCKYFQRTVGETGMCKLHKKAKKSSWNCKAGIYK